METTGKQFRKRNAILAHLRQSKEHPSADDLFVMLQGEHSDISRASVYRNLALFKQQGLIISVGCVNGVERFDGRLDPHVHFACTRCGRVVDVPGMEIPKDIPLCAEESLHSRVEDAQLMLTGICEYCL